MKNKKVVVGMSGGVDSSVAAYLLKKEGYDVIGVTMEIWKKDATEVVENEGGCCGITAVDDARRVAQKLGIPHYVMNFRDIFQEKVIDYFVKEYQLGHTPNPCIACNRYVKWEALLQRSLEIGADYIATGHYARIAQLENGRYAIQNSVTARKDQTYALYNLTQWQLEHTLMPVGAYHKEEIRKIAAREGLFVANKPDSQEICFIPDKTTSVSWRKKPVRRVFRETLWMHRVKCLDSIKELHITRSGREKDSELRSVIRSLSARSVPNQMKWYSETVKKSFLIV